MSKMSTNEIFKSGGKPLFLTCSILSSSLLFIFALTINASTQTRTLADISWIAGDWQTAPDEKRQIEEHWTQVVGASMMGMGRTVAGDKTVEFEYLRIEQREDGIYYVAHPKARCPGTDFKLSRASATEAVF